MNVLMVAAENGALPGGKVGGLGDVIRELPPALQRAGHLVTVITPGYGILASPANRRLLAEISVAFCARRETLALFLVSADSSGVRQLVLEHPLFSLGGSGRIYITDDNGPFATDAHRFALFCAAVARCVVDGVLGGIELVHCHDWHTGVLAVLRRNVPELAALASIPLVFSIHNLSLQGIRPYRDNGSSLLSWFPDLSPDPGPIIDPRYVDCFNPMRAGINLADRVHTVSPTYAREILRPSQWDQGLVGGEGLEQDLILAAREGRLWGILNGCEYEVTAVPALAEASLYDLMQRQLDVFAGAFNPPSPSYYFAAQNLQYLKRRRLDPGPRLVSIGRLTTQKLFLLTREFRGSTVMDLALERLHGGSFIMLGSGDPWHDRFFTDVMRRHRHFIYLCGYSDELAAALYASGDLFVMPSIYEPCGISQMLALRAGVPCLVHGVGGLNDTVIHGVNGFSFGGEGLDAKLHRLLETLELALSLFREQPLAWQDLCAGARSSRFTWDQAVDELLAGPYRLP